MKIIVHKHFTLESKTDIYNQYSTPVWEIEIQSPVLDTLEFEAELRNDNNFVVSDWHHNNLRSTYNGTGVVSEFLAESKQDFLLNLVNQSPIFQTRYHQSINQYQCKTAWTSKILRDQAGFAMAPHLDNNHVMIQMVVNLLQDNDTATELYYFNEPAPCYRAPLKKNHGVIFLNTPGAIHSIANVNKTRWILYGGLVI